MINLRALGAAIGFSAACGQPSQPIEAPKPTPVVLAKPSACEEFRALLAVQVVLYHMGQDPVGERLLRGTRDELSQFFDAQAFEVIGEVNDPIRCVETGQDAEKPREPKTSTATRKSTLLL